MPSKRSSKAGRKGSSQPLSDVGLLGASGAAASPTVDVGVNGSITASLPGVSGLAHRGVPSPPPRPASPTAAQHREQQLAQQQVYQHQLNLIRVAQQQRPVFPVTEVVRTGFMFLVAMLSTATVFREYGWAMTIVVVTAMYACGLFRFLSVVARWCFRPAEGVLYDEALRRADIMKEPIVKKMTHTGDNAVLSYGCSCMQGWRRTMEDAHTTLTLDDGGFFGVYDGHGGASTSKFCGANMYNFIAETKAFREGNIPTAMYDGFIAVDRHLESFGTDRSGCTAVTLLVRGDDLFCANAGDSRCVLCRDGEAVPLSVDHKPYLPMEQARIERAGGYVFNRRVNGVLALSRAIGDYVFKRNSQVPWDQQAVTSAPEVRTARLNRDKDEFVVLACDGIWDILSSEQVVEFVRDRLQQRDPLGKICELLMDMCLSPHPFAVGCDNMSVIIVQFKRAGAGTMPPPLVNAGQTATAAADVDSQESRAGLFAGSPTHAVRPTPMAEDGAEPRVGSGPIDAAPPSPADPRGSGAVAPGSASLRVGASASATHAGVGEPETGSQREVQGGGAGLVTEGLAEMTEPMVDRPSSLMDVAEETVEETGGKAE